MLRSIDWARWYAAMATSVSHLERAYSPARFLETLGEHLPRGRAKRVLELGCAPGRWLAWAASRLGVRAVGVELEPEGVRLSHALYPEILLTRGDAFRLPFASRSFDALYSIGLIEHFDDPSGIVREAWRVLRPGGTSVWLVPNLEPGSLCGWHWRTFQRDTYEAHRIYSLNELAALVERERFQVTHREYSGLYIPHFQRVLGRLPLRSLLRRLERPHLASNLVVVSRRHE